MKRGFPSSKRLLNNRNTSNPHKLIASTCTTSLSTHHVNSSVSTMQMLSQHLRFSMEPHHRGFSTQSARDEQDNDFPKSSSQPPQLTLTLKQLVRPFLMKFHPDRQGIDSAKNTTIAREVNLDALQTLNGMIDTIDQIYTRAAEPSKFMNTRGRLEVQKKYIIEFLVPTEGKGGVRKQKDVPVASRRSVELTFSERDVSAVQMVDAANGRYSVPAAISLRVKAMNEIVKLLRVAGLQVPTNLHALIEEASNELSMHERMLLEDELDLGGNKGKNFGRSFKYSTRPKTPYEESRERYMNSVDWKKYNVMYDEALEDMKRDAATDGLISMNEERKQRLVAEVISRIRIFDVSVDMDGDGDGASVAGGDEDSLDVLQQLIGIRRMSLLLNDHFEELEMEEMGRLWETMVIVLTPERKANQQPGKTGLPYSRLKRLRKGRESGFKFSFHSDDRLTVYVPIDFLDDEFIGEMKTHLGDFFSLCLSRGGLEDYFPSYYAEFKGSSNFDD